MTCGVAKLAKQWTGDDWDAIESQSENDKETDLKLVEPMVVAFKMRFSITATVEGNDCDSKRNALWLRYWSDAVSAGV